MVPVVRQQVQVNYGFDSTGANAGYNPADPVFGSAAGADSVNTFLLEYRTALDTLSARIAGGYYVDPDSLALAEATLASGTAYYAGLDSLFVVSGAAGSFVPLASSNAGQAMAGEVSNVQTALAALSISSFTQPLPLPADALSPSEYNTYLTNPAGSIGATPFETHTSFLLGDMEFGASYTLIDRWNLPERPGGLRVVAQGLVRLPTGYQPLPNDFVSLPTGGGQTDIQVSVVADVGGRRFGARLAGSYNDQLSTTADRRVTLPSQPIPWSNRLATVSQDPGDEFTLERPALLPAGARLRRRGCPAVLVARGRCGGVRLGRRRNLRGERQRTRDRHRTKRHDRGRRAQLGAQPGRHADGDQVPGRCVLAL